LNPGRRGGKPATNRLSYGAAKVEVTLFHLEERNSTNSMEQNLSWEAESCSASQEIHRIYRTQQFITIFTVLASCFPQSLQSNAGEAFQLGCDRFLPYPF
jgi:hypothetical protein